MQPRDLDLNEAVTNMTKMLRRILGEDVADAVQICACNRCSSTPTRACSIKC